MRYQEYLPHFISDDFFKGFYTLSLGLLLAFSIFSAGMFYVLLTTLIALLLHLIQDDYEKGDSQAVRLYRCFMVSAISVVFFMVTFPIMPIYLGGGMVLKIGTGMNRIYIGFLLLGSMMDVSVLPHLRLSYFRNIVILGLLYLCGCGIWVTLTTPFAMLIVSKTISSILVYMIKWGVPLLLMFSLNHLLGRKPEELLGFKTLSLSQFVQYFILGICVVCLSDMVSMVLLSVFLPQQVLLYSYNIVNWEAATYIFNQSLMLVAVLMQTVVEEITFRTILDGILTACGFGSLDKPGAEKGDYYILELVIKALIMSMWFSFVHLANPVETGRAFGSLLEKFMVYLESFAYCLAYLLTGNIAFSWGMHFAHNFRIGLERFSYRATDNGFFQVNIMKDTMPSSEVIQRSVMKIVVNVLFVVGASYCVEKINEAVGKEDAKLLSAS